MKKILTRLQSFAVFDIPLRNTYIQQAFVTIHEHYRKEYHGWSPSATRKKVIADYWIKHVLTHLGALYLMAVLITLSFNTCFNQFYLTGLLLAGLNQPSCTGLLALRVALLLRLPAQTGYYHRKLRRQTTEKTQKMPAGANVQFCRSGCLLRIR